MLSLSQARVVASRGQAIVDLALVAQYSARVAAQLAARLAKKGASLTARQVESMCDKLIASIDLDARREKPKHRRPFVDVTPVGGDQAVLTVRLAREKCAQIAELIDEVAGTVCRGDGRDLQERQVDAFCAIVDGYATLGCRCGKSECDRAERRPRIENLPDRVHVDLLLVLNETAYRQEGVGQGTAGHAADDGQAAVFSDTATEESPYDVPVVAKSPVAQSGSLVRVATDSGVPGSMAAPGLPGFSLPGLLIAGGRLGAGLGGPMAADDMREMLARCEVNLRTFGARRAGGTVVAAAASGYTPTVLQQRFVRMRHSHCVFPGCQVPAERCQLDHVVEYDHRDPAAGGRTDVGNLVPLCGFHHRIKTHTGWLSDLLPDGTVEWRQPDGTVYRAGVEQDTDLFPALGELVWQIRPAVEEAQPEAAGSVKPLDGEPTRTQARNRAREAMRENNRRLRHDGDEAHGIVPDTPPPF
ncbi:HNH endonuclease signature motif containing protein [Tsukamurella soli]|uniref:HNH endonuclease signature motif containing protein n=1 Tax=Tsukamurella soli TaxID=644556 RepID=UPI0036187E5F